MKQVSQKDANRYFQGILEGIKDSYTLAMQKGDMEAIQGLCSLDFSSKFPMAHTGSYVLSHLFKKTIKKYTLGGSIPWIDYDEIVDKLGERKINPLRVDMVRDALITNGFVELNQGTINTLNEEKTNASSGKIITLKIRLTELWIPFLNNYLRKKIQTATFPHILGRQIYLSYLAGLKNKNLIKTPTGVSSFKIFPIIFNQLTPKGYVDDEQCEKIFHQQGSDIMYHDFCEADGIKQEPIRFFVEDNLRLGRKKLNKNSVKAWNVYVLPLANAILNKHGMTI